MSGDDNQVEINHYEAPRYHRKIMDAMWLGYGGGQFNPEHYVPPTVVQVYAALRYLHENRHKRESLTYTNIGEVCARPPTESETRNGKTGPQPMSVATVKRSLKALRLAGWIRVTPRYHQGLRTGSTIDTTELPGCFGGDSEPTDSGWVTSDPQPPQATDSGWVTSDPAAPDETCGSPVTLPEGHQRPSNIETTTETITNQETKSARAASGSTGSPWFTASTEPARRPPPPNGNSNGGQGSLLVEAERLDLDAATDRLTEAFMASRPVPRIRDEFNDQQWRQYRAPFRALLQRQAHDAGRPGMIDETEDVDPWLPRFAFAAKHERYWCHRTGNPKDFVKAWRTGDMAGEIEGAADVAALAATAPKKYGPTAENMQKGIDLARAMAAHRQQQQQLQQPTQTAGTP